MPFADILGHDRIIEVLRRTLRNGKTAHSYLFEGVSGSGRKKTAVALIQALFCKLADDASSEPVFDAAALNVVLERFLSVSLDLSHQGRIEGPPGPPDHHAFRRVA